MAVESAIIIANVSTSGTYIVYNYIGLLTLTVYVQEKEICEF